MNFVLNVKQSVFDIWVFVIALLAFKKLKNTFKHNTE